MPACHLATMVCLQATPLFYIACHYSSYRHWQAFSYLEAGNVAQGYFARNTAKGPVLVLLKILRGAIYRNTSPKLRCT